MNNATAAVKRWNWINGWLTASLNASIASLGLKLGGLTIGSLVRKYSRSVRESSVSLRLTHGPAVEDWEIEYILHMERELWGTDWADYVNFFSSSRGQEGLLQSFHFVLAFYIIERCLKLLLERSERYDVGRRKLRRRVFGLEDGLLTVQVPRALFSLGPPFFLAGSTTRTQVVGGNLEAWEGLRKKGVPHSLESFYKSTTGKRHFCDVIDAALSATRRDHLKEHLKAGKGKPLPRGTRAYWYDVLWHYSEAVRYHPLWIAAKAKEAPYYWNRTIRWFASIVITGLLLLAQARGAPVANVWGNYAGDRLAEALGGEERFPASP